MENGEGLVEEVLCKLSSKPGITGQSFFWLVTPMPNISSKPATIIYSTGHHLPEEWVSDPQGTNMSGKEYLLGALGISSLRKIQK